jgi:hypothetical protein
VKFTWPLILGSLLTASCLPCWGQQPSSCKVYFKVVLSDPRIPGSPMDKLSDVQQKWLKEKAPKKYPSVCFNPEKASYAIVWNEEKQSKANTRPHVETNFDSNGASVGSTTTYTVELSILYITHVCVMKIGPDGNMQDPPIFVDSDPARSTQSSASAIGLEHGMKFLKSLGSS